MSDAFAVVGGGLIGLAVAYELAKRGAPVTLFERDEIGRAASWAGAGMLAPFSEELPDPALLALCRASLAAYPAFVDELRERTGLDPALLTHGTLHVALEGDPAGELARRAAVYRSNGGAVSVLDRTQTLGFEPAVSRAATGGVFIANEAQIDNRRLTRALAAACSALGVRFEQTRTLELCFDSRRVRGIRTERGFAAVRAVVNAAGAWAGELGGVPAEARVPVYPVAGEMLALAVPRHFARAVIWHGHTYLVPRRDGRLLVGATVVARGFDRRVTAGGVCRLLGAALGAAPALAGFALVESWAGLRPGTPDGRPYLGPTPLDGYFVAAGHYRNGILLAPITARALADVMLTGSSTVALGSFAPGRCAPESAVTVANASGP